MKTALITLLCILVYTTQLTAQQQLVKGQRIPRLTTDQRDQIPVENNPQTEGLFIFNIDINCLQYWTGEVWANLCGEPEYPRSVVKRTSVIGYLERMTDSDGNDVWALELDSPDGFFSVRVNIPGNISTVSHANQNINFQLRSNRPASTAISWNYTTFWGGGCLHGSGFVANVPSRRWGGIRGNGAGSTFTVAERNGVGHWGDRGLSDGTGNGLEQRRYTWVEIGNHDNITAYKVWVFAVINNHPPTTSVSPTRVKAHITFEQTKAI